MSPQRDDFKHSAAGLAIPTDLGRLNEQSSWSSAQTAEGATTDMTKHRVMVVDDEVGALTLIGIMLERGGFEVMKAHDAYDALNQLQHKIPDLLILDVMMPGMDGIELCRHIRAAPATKDTPILILSARGDPESVEQGMNAGADDYLSKPILHHDLITKVREMLNLDGKTD